jgi:hypothetical protein
MAFDVVVEVPSGYVAGDADTSQRAAISIERVRKNAEQSLAHKVRGAKALHGKDEILNPYVAAKVDTSQQRRCAARGVSRSRATYL